MKGDTLKINKKIKFLVVFVVIMIAISFIFYVFLYSPEEYSPAPLDGHLKPINIDKSNNSITFTLIINNTKNIELKENGKYNFRLHIYNYSENNNWEQWDSDEYRFNYIDENDDELLNTGDQLIINSSKREFDEYYVIEVEMSVSTNRVGGHIMSEVNINKQS